MNAALVWHNGQLKPWAEANVHVSTHALHYGSSVFEGERVYATPDGPRFFRLRDHTRRLFASARMYAIDIGYDMDAIDAACREVVRANGMESAYVRPIVFRGAAGLGILPQDDAPVDVAVMAMSWGNYHGDARERGADVCVSSWRRAAADTVPAWAKAGGHYLNSQLVALEARRNGYDEGLPLGCDGLLSEGAAENLFLVSNGVLVTPPTSASLLVGITRDSVITLARALGVAVEERALPREALYCADEVFMCGTAAEITPVRSVDRVTVGNGGVGPLTRALQDAFFGLFDGRTPDRWNWLSSIQAAAQAKKTPAVDEECGHGWPLLDSRDQGRSQKKTHRPPAHDESPDEPTNHSPMDGHATPGDPDGGRSQKKTHRPPARDEAANATTHQSQGNDHANPAVANNDRQQPHPETTA